VTRRFRTILRLRRAVALALAATAVAAPAAMADTPTGQDMLSVDARPAAAAPATSSGTPVGQDQLSIHTRDGRAAVRVAGCPSNCHVVRTDARDAAPAVDRVSPDARDAARPAPAINRVSPDARDNGRREPAPVVISSPAVSATDHFDWLDAGIGAAALAALALLGGTTAVMRTRRGPVRAS
jgi:hypothetical protein